MVVFFCLYENFDDEVWVLLWLAVLHKAIGAMQLGHMARRRQLCRL